MNHSKEENINSFYLAIPRELLESSAPYDAFQLYDLAKTIYELDEASSRDERSRREVLKLLFPLDATSRHTSGFVGELSQKKEL